MEVFFSLEREISMATEAMLIEHNIPCTRKFTHAELEPALKAIREIEAAKGRNNAEERSK